MTQARSLQSIALLSLALLAPAVRAEQPENHLIQQTYPIANVLKACGNCPKCPAYLVQVIPHVVAPESWCDQGGQGSIEYCEACQSLVIFQSPQVHEQVGDFLRLVEKMAAVCPKATSAVPSCPCKQSACHAEKLQDAKTPKHVIRFVIDGFEYKDADKNGLTIQHLEIEYKGDGIEIDDAKDDTGPAKPQEKDNGDQGDNGSMMKLWNRFDNLFQPESTSAWRTAWRTTHSDER